MQKRVILFGLLLSVFSIICTQELNAQSTSSKWDGPRWASMQVTNTVNQWINTNTPPLDDDGDWWHTDYTYIGRGTWLVVISWGTNFREVTLGSATLQVKSSGAYTVIN